MKRTNRFLLPFFIILSVLMTACDTNEDPDTTDDSENKIISFTFSALTPAVSGVIDDVSHSILVEVPAGTDVTALMPTIVVSEGATVSPASGVATDFTSAVIYTVTAADGNAQFYGVTVQVESDEPEFTLDPYDGVTVIGQGEFFAVNGSGFPNYQDISIVLTNLSDDSETEFMAGSFSTESYVYVVIPDYQPLGDYTLRIEVGDFSVALDETFTIIHHAPIIDSIRNINIVPGDTTLIYGRFFMEEGNTVIVYNDEEEFELVILSESDTAIQTLLPEDVVSGAYSLYVVSNERDMPFTIPFWITTEPILSLINDYSFARGETMTLTGKNLRKAGFATNINFVPFGATSGPTLVRSGTPNEAGTEVTYTLPGDFPTGTYSILVEVDFEYSEEYGEIIQITP